MDFEFRAMELCTVFFLSYVQAVKCWYLRNELLTMNFLGWLVSCATFIAPSWYLSVSFNDLIINST